MNVKIYEELTGQLIFPIVPGKEPERDENVVILFNNHIDLYVEKKVNELRISCHAYIGQGIESKGYYIKSISKYEDYSFTEFKKESNKALRTLGILRNPDDVNNVMLDHIEKLDLDIYFHEDIDIIAHALEFGEYLEYQAGNVDEITIFCKDVLKRIGTSKVAISFEVGCTLGDINILRTRKQEEPLRANERTRVILDKNKKELLEKEKKEEAGRARDKINDGTNLIKEGLTILRSSGQDPQKISDEIDKIYEEISVSNKIRLKEKKPKGKEENGKRGVKTNGDMPKFSRTTAIILAIVGALIIYSIIWGSPLDIINGFLGRSSPSPEKGTPQPVATLPPIKNMGNGNIISTDNNNFGYDIRRGAQ